MKAEFFRCFNQCDLLFRIFIPKTMFTLGPTESKTFIKTGVREYPWYALYEVDATGLQLAGCLTRLNKLDCLTTCSEV